MVNLQLIYTFAASIVPSDSFSTFEFYWNLNFIIWNFILGALAQLVPIFANP